MGQVLWATYTQHFKDGATSVDYPSILSAANSLGLSHAIEGSDEQKYVRAVLNQPVQCDNLRGFVARVVKLAYAREQIARHEQAIRDLSDVTGDEPVSRIRTMSEAPILDAADINSGQELNSVRLMGDGSVEYAKYLMDNPRVMAGITP